MDVQLREAFRNAKLYTDGRSYCLIGLPIEALPRVHEIIAAVLPPFWSIISDKDEISLLLPSDVWATQAESLTLGRCLPRVTSGYRLITLDVVLPPSLVGFLAHLTRPLAEAGIPILAFSAKLRDHLFVPKEKFAPAWSILEALLTSARNFPV